MSKGSVEITLQDKEGNIKKQIRQNNAQTDIFKTQIFYLGLNSVVGAAKRTTSNTVSNVIGMESFGYADKSSGIFLLPEYVTEKNMYPAPYVNESGVFDISKVTFYNDQQTIQETEKELAIKTENCYFDHKNNVSQCEYFKVNGTGIVKSIIFGKAATSETYLNNIIKDYNLNPNAETFVDNTYVLEHGMNNTTIWKTRSNHEQMSYNCKTKEYKKYDNMSLDTNIKAFTQGLKIGNKMFRVAKTTTLRMTVTYVEDCFKDTTTKNIIIDFPSVDTEMATTITTPPYPIMIYRYDNNTLEVFYTTSERLSYYSSGYITQKAIIDLETMGSTIEVLPEFPYCLSSNCVTYNNWLQYSGYHHGLYYNGSYYIPHMYIGILGVRKNTFHFTQSANNYTTIRTRFDGLITSDFKNIERHYNHISYNGTSNAEGLATQLVISHEGVTQCRVGQPKMPYLYTTSLTNYVNLNEPVIKEPDDILKVRYIDKLKALEDSYVSQQKEG